MSDNDDDNSEDGEQVRIILILARECLDRSLQIPVQEAIAVPADTGRKGLSAIVNHLLDRRTTNASSAEKEEDEDASDDDDDDEINGNNKLPAISFDFIVDNPSNASNSNSQRLLRTGIEREARRLGLTLEEAVHIAYFPAPQPLALVGESEPLPEWISAMSFVPSANILCTACYDGSIRVLQSPPTAKNKTTTTGEAFVPTTMVLKAQIHHQDDRHGPITCMSTADDEIKVWVATGSMDHSLQIHQIDSQSVLQMNHFASCTGGHSATIGCVDLFVHPQSNQKLLASGDWDGAICVWDLTRPLLPEEDEEPTVKKSKIASTATTITTGKATTNHKPQQRHPTLTPKISLRAHSSKVSGVSWGNYEKYHSDSDHPSSMRLLITGSWDHSLKVWDVERQDCVLTLNGSRVVTCLDTSYHSSAIVATGHPDCTVRLWDTRTSNDSNDSSSSLLVSDNTFRPSHKQWVSAVQWSGQNPYHLASTSHDGTVKLWDIRSSLPLHTVRAFGTAKAPQKGLSLAYADTTTTESGGSFLLFAGGSDGIVKQFQCLQ